MGEEEFRARFVTCERLDEAAHCIIEYAYEYFENHGCLPTARNIYRYLPKWQTQAYSISRRRDGAILIESCYSENIYILAQRLVIERYDRYFNRQETGHGDGS